MLGQERISEVRAVRSGVGRVSGVALWQLLHCCAGRWSMLLVARLVRGGRTVGAARQRAALRCPAHGCAWRTGAHAQTCILCFAFLLRACGCVCMRTGDTSHALQSAGRFHCRAVFSRAAFAGLRLQSLGALALCVSGTLCRGGEKRPRRDVPHPHGVPACCCSNPVLLARALYGDCFGLQFGWQ